VRDVIVVGASVGGVAAISQLLSKLPADLPAIVGIVLHRGALSQADWSRTFRCGSDIQVVEPRQGQRLVNGVVYIAPSDKHMTFASGGAVLSSSLKQHFTRPAIDPLFSSAALAYTSRVVGVVLTGGGRDGTRGLLDIAAAGGLALVQTPDEAECGAMPESALAHDHVRAALTLDQLATVLPRLARGFSCEVLAAVGR
jgi:two-component system chemotaxis response regulator CheB